MIAGQSTGADETRRLRQHRLNSFDFLRFVGALMVIVGHSQELLTHSTPTLIGKPLAHIGVIVFFSVSGYLVTESWLRDPAPGRFLVRRAVRIFPALAVVVVLSALVLGPMLTTLPLDAYFLHPQVTAYFWNIALSPQYSLPGVFADNAYPNVVNGALWSLAPEFVCYLAVLAVGLLPRRVGPFAVVALFVALAAVSAQPWPTEQYVAYGSDLFQAATVTVYFAAGAVIRVFRVPLRADVALVLIVGALAVSGHAAASTLAWNVALPYAILAFGRQNWPVLRSWGRHGDPSYGMYLYAFPIQQVLSMLSDGAMSVPMMIVLTSALAIGAGYLSWFTIEKPALGYRPPPRADGVQIPPSQVIDRRAKAWRSMQ